MPTTFTQALSTQQASSSLFVRTIALTKSSSSASSATLAKVTGFVRTLTATIVMSIVFRRNVLKNLIALQSVLGGIRRGITKTMLAQQASSSLMFFGRFVSLTVTIVNTSLLVRSLAKVLSATQANTSTLFKNILKPLTVTLDNLVFITKTYVYKKILAATFSSWSYFQKTILKPLSASQTMLNTIDRFVNFYRTLSGNSTVSSTLQKNRAILFLVSVVTVSAFGKIFNKVLFASFSSISRLKLTHLRSLITESTLSIQFQREISKIWLVVSPTTNTILKNNLRTLLATSQAFSSFSFMKAYLRTMSVTVTTVNSVFKKMYMTLIATSISTISSIIRKWGSSC